MRRFFARDDAAGLTFDRDDGGTIVVLVALLMSAMCAGTGSAVDAGLADMQRRQLQMASDFGSAAATYEMESNWDGSSFGTLTQTQIENVAKDYAGRNRWSSTTGTATFTYIQKDGTTSATFNANSRGVSAKLTNPFPSTFGKVAGITQYTATTNAAAEFGAMTQGFATVPLVLNNDSLGSYGTSKQFQPANGGGGGDNVNFASIVPPGCTVGDQTCYTNAMQNGAGSSITVPGTYTANSFDTSSVSSTTKSALQDRINGALGETCSSYSSTSRRVVIAPIANGDIGGSTVTLIGFAAFFISSVDPANPAQYFTGCFVKLTAGRGTFDPNATGTSYAGVTTMTMVKPP